jgi:hypothetical protein
MQLTLGQAARTAGVGKTTLARAIKAGRLSATRREDGGYLIDPAELCRVYPPGASLETVDVVHRTTPENDPEVQTRLAALEAELRGLRELLAEVRSSRDVEREQHRMFLTALPPPAPVADRTTETVAQPAHGSHWLGFWRRRADVRASRNGRHAAS